MTNHQLFLERKLRDELNYVKVPVFYTDQFFLTSVDTGSVDIRDLIKALNSINNNLGTALFKYDITDHYGDKREVYGYRREENEEEFIDNLENERMKDFRRIQKEKAELKRLYKKYNTAMP